MREKVDDPAVLAEMGSAIRSRITSGEIPVTLSYFRVADPAIVESVTRQPQHEGPVSKNGKGVELRPFFGYFGGKWRDTPLYPKPEHDTIVEPFAGSAGYSLRFSNKRVILYEKDPILTSVWEYLIGVMPTEILKLPDLGPEDCVDDLKGVCQEAKWLIGFWLNRGVASPRKRPSKWMRIRIRPGSFWGERVRNTVAGQVDQIRHWKIRNRSYEACRVTREATWFIDPPYQVTGRHYRHGPDDLDYKSLAAWCRARPGLAIVCENQGANWLGFGPLQETKTTRNGRRSREVVWIHRRKRQPTAPSV